jgi:Zn-dependent peptidase ImmA (M78 family)
MTNMIDAELQEIQVDYKPPIPSRASKPNIWSFAEKQRNTVGLKNGFQLADLVTQNGGRISYIDLLDDDQTDAIVVEPDGTFRILLSSQTGSLRDNFTIAHELGHLLLHWPLVKKEHPGHGMRATRRVEEGDQALVRCEWEANWFASAFLMPAEEFKVAYNNGVAGDTFGVTSAAVEVRAKTLGLND